MTNCSSLKDLQEKVAELETETERLSRALEVQKAATVEAQTAAAKQVEEASRELQKKSTEADQLRQKLRQYSDYDEVKRELEIMKVRSTLPLICNHELLTLNDAVCRVRRFRGR